MRLAFDDDGQGPLLVFLHGFPLDRSMWSDQRAGLKGTFRIIAPDLRGHGDSPATAGVTTIDAMADDVLELLDQLHITDPAIFCGLSMGGYVALSIADRHPGRVKGLILANTRASADSPEAALAREGTARHVEKLGETLAYFTGILPKLFARGTFERNPGLVADWHSRMSRTSIGTIVATLRALATRPDRSGILPNLTIPTLVLAGSDDQIIPREESERLASALPDSELVVIPDSGHLSPLENPRATDQALARFFDRFR